MQCYPRARSSVEPIKKEFDLWLDTKAPSTTTNEHIGLVHNIPKAVKSADLR